LVESLSIEIVEEGRGRLMKRISVILFIILFSISIFSASVNNVLIEYAGTISGELNYWNKPGKYTPANAFDGNLKTCYGKGNDDSIDRGRILFDVRFNQKIKIDAIKIAAGIFLNEKYYKMNNRIKTIKFEFYEDVSPYSNYPFFLRGQPKGEEKFDLDDSMEYQFLKLKKAYNIRMIRFIKKSIYKGSKYPDTCISDIKFFYKGKEVKISNIEKSKKNYIKILEDRIRYVLGDTLYNCWNKDKKDAKFYFRKNGKIDISFIGADNEINYLKKFSKWKVDNGKLLFLSDNKWQLVKYGVSEDYFKIYQIGGKKMSTTGRNGRKNPFFVTRNYRLECGRMNDASGR